MKYISKLFLLLTLFLSSCSILDKDIDTNLDKDDIFTDERFAQGFLNSTYRELMNGFNRLDNAMFACASDEAICSYSGSAVHGYNNGAITPFYNPEEEVWKTMYAGIRKANVFLRELDTTIKDAGLIDKNEQSKATYTRMRGEALFLRAFYHFELAKRFSNIQLIDKVLTEEEAMFVKQSTFAEAIEFIVKDCVNAATYLDNFNKDAAEYGRATCLSALALKSRALLYLASKLNNPAGDKQLWKDAADAAKEIMDIQVKNPSRVGLLSAYYSVFTTPYNNEILFATSSESSNEIELYNNPISYGGKGYTNPTQELVDAYETTKGYPIDDPRSGYNPENPYKSRDPRMEYTISYNGLKFSGTPIETFVGGKDGLNKTPTATRTGYYMRKFIDQNLDLSKDQKRRRPWILFRYAEILLNYAEAMNEYLEAPDQSVYDAVNQIRKRAKIPQLNIRMELSKEEMRERIRNERRVELAFEEHRFWDVRRWNEGNTYFNRPIHGMRITVNGEEIEYEQFVVEERMFETKMNYYPIPQSELQKNGGLVQNPGW
ncbi:RagB/SusD family nutrient uptake outer membrane protein [Bacteroides sp. K03]|uniref:RagB/SusD family nutrient uptake outer membrane protein n=1 Tax=Bacteroides TaxID=816 RepID=UPI001C8BEEA9|nr:MULTISPECIES: RagB/SusD family nutrient uptake outer membrane protein [Bacteroides]MBX9187448.1 RagB/SusD family nutrient uptake outer membrane protein [Bacteroides sp. K03]